MRQLSHEEIVYIEIRHERLTGLRPAEPPRIYLAVGQLSFLTKDVKMIVIACNTATEQSSGKRLKPS